MKIEQTALEGVLILTPKRFGDPRGFFSESWNAKRQSDAGVDIDFVQDNRLCCAYQLTNGSPLSPDGFIPRLL
ncbi:dTDP-4-dehydrorhamnose 3,5-epimerase family protein (plasmid) [Loktanella salsilacus]|nr:dTDP-4-dehydrorhamnose 3,5-epimerase family protein [Loktanella salsilacus]